MVLRGVTCPISGLMSRSSDHFTDKDKSRREITEEKPSKKVAKQKLKQFSFAFDET